MGGKEKPFRDLVDRWGPLLLFINLVTMVLVKPDVYGLVTANSFQLSTDWYQYISVSSSLVPAESIISNDKSIIIIIKFEPSRLVNLLKNKILFRNESVLSTSYSRIIISGKFIKISKRDGEN